MVQPQSYPRDWIIKRSSDGGNSFQLGHKLVPVDQTFDFVKMKYTDAKFYFIPKDWDWSVWIDPATGNKDRFGLGNVNAFTRPRDIYKYQEHGAMVGDAGNILQTSILSYRRVHYAHQYDYNSIDGFKNQSVAVGDRTIAANNALHENQVWHEVYQPNGSSFSQVFTKVRFTAENNFYIGGKKGLLWRAKL